MHHFTFRHTAAAALTTLVVMTAAGAALAHPHPVAHVHGADGIAAGFAHPFLGLDHLVAMIGVGLWAAAIGGRARWLIPGSFLLVMAAAGMAGLTGGAHTAIEGGIAASLLLLGLLIAMALRPPLALGLALVGGFAAFHGYAHGSEIPAAGDPVSYGLGMLLASALLLATGLVLGAGLSRLALGPSAMRLGGLLTASFGGYLLIAL